MTDQIPAKKSNKALITIIVVLLLVCVVLPLCLICMLALLGPAIGNVFSNVTSGLSP